MTRSYRPLRQGLYDPAHEHDSCGVGFVVNLKGVRSHQLVQQALEVLRNLEHRGAVGCDPNSGDGAGILLQIPHDFFRSECGEDLARLPAAGQLRGGDALPAPGRQRPPPLRAPRRTDRRRTRPEVSRLAHGADRQQPPRRGGALPGAGDPPALRRPAARARRRDRLRAAPLRLPPPPDQHRARPGDRLRRDLLRLQLLGPGHRLQGDAHPAAAPPVLSRSAQPGDQERPGAGPLALLHQHLPQLDPRPSLPLPRPQRRDQHPARQRQLDGGAPGAADRPAARRRLGEDPAGHRRGGQRLGDVRQLPRVPASLRPQPAPRGDDDGSRAVEPPWPDEPGEARLLRVPRLPDGALGRPGGDRLHRRRADRRRPRPQRPAPLALLGDPRRPGGPRLRVGGPRRCRPTASWKRGGCSRARCSWSTPPRGGSSPTRRSRRGSSPPSPTGSGSTPTWCASPSCRRRRPPPPRRPAC